MLTYKLNIHIKVYETLLVAISVSIPLFFPLSNYLIGLLVLNWIIAGSFKENIFKLGENNLFPATIAIFFLFALGLLHTSNLLMGFKDLEHKLSILFIPLVVFASNAPSNRTINYIFIGFTISTLLVASVALVIGFFKFLNTGDLSFLFYHQLSNNVGLHAVYLSCYLAFSTFIIIHKESVKNVKILNSVLLVILVVYIIGLLILLSSKTLLAVFLIALTVYALLILRKGKKLLWGFLATIFLNVLILITLMATPYTSQRFKEVLKTNFELLEQEKFNYDTEFNGLSLRLLFWKFAYLINQRENTELIGVGTGDSRDKLNEIYREYNLYLGNSQIHGDTGYLNYNTHNQFVETYLKLGMVGLLYLIMYFIFVLYFSVVKRDILFTIWLIIFISFSLTETTLQVNKGIVYFAFFISLFLKTSNLNKHNKAHTLKEIQ